MLLDEADELWSCSCRNAVLSRVLRHVRTSGFNHNNTTLDGEERDGMLYACNCVQKHMLVSDLGWCRCSFKARKCYTINGSNDTRHKD